MYVNNMQQNNTLCDFYVSFKNLELKINTPKLEIPLMEWFSFECRKTKTKVITVANYKEYRQYSELIKIRSNHV